MEQKIGSDKPDKTVNLEMQKVLRCLTKDVYVCSGNDICVSDVH